jgi:hypothetical protein
MNQTHINSYDLMGGFVNLDIDVITQHMGKQIEYFELWDAEQSEFKRGGSFIHGIYKDKLGITRIYADTIWGTGLENAILVNQEGFCFPYKSHIYIAPAPFLIYKITWINEQDVEESRLIPIESDIEILLAARRFTEGSYRSLRVNLDGSVYRY